MRWALAVLMIVLVSDSARAGTTPECAECNLAVTIQIHDYSNVPRESLSAARDMASRLYGQIGVRTDWIGVVRPKARRGELPDGEQASRGQIGQLTLIMLTEQMTARGRVADDVLGYAAVPTTGMGR